MAEGNIIHAAGAFIVGVVKEELVGEVHAECVLHVLRDQPPPNKRAVYYAAPRCRRRWECWRPPRVRAAVLFALQASHTGVAECVYSYAK